MAVAMLVDELIRIGRFYARFEQLMAQCCGSISVSQCTVLQELSAGGQSVSELAGHAGLSVSAMTRLLDALEKRNLVERRRSTEDRRRVEVVLTGAGGAEAGRLRDMTTAVVSQVLQAIPAEDRAGVVTSMSQLRSAMESVSDPFQAMEGKG
jgi:DNA-binding MarR family transcriptional regulator